MVCMITIDEHLIISPNRCYITTILSFIQYRFVLNNGFRHIFIDLTNYGFSFLCNLPKFSLVFQILFFSSAFSE